MDKIRKSFHVMEAVEQKDQLAGLSSQKQPFMPRDREDDFSVNPSPMGRQSIQEEFSFPEPQFQAPQPIVPRQSPAKSPIIDPAALETLVNRIVDQRLANVSGMVNRIIEEKFQTLVSKGTFQPLVLEQVKNSLLEIFTEEMLVKAFKNFKQRTSQKS
jgi:hypothetical protein